MGEHQDFKRRNPLTISASVHRGRGQAAYPQAGSRSRTSGKEDTLITIQIGFQLAERFGMVYTDRDDQKKHPIVIHRTSIGCYERYLALLIEAYAGAFPTWLAPVQAKIATITDRADQAALASSSAWSRRGLRPGRPLLTKKIGSKIREAQMEKVP